MQSVQVDQPIQIVHVVTFLTRFGAHVDILLMSTVHNLLSYYMNIYLYPHPYPRPPNYANYLARNSALYCKHTYFGVHSQIHTQAHTTQI